MKRCKQEVVEMMCRLKIIDSFNSKAEKLDNMTTRFCIIIYLSHFDFFLNILISF